MFTIERRQFSREDWTERPLPPAYLEYTKSQMSHLRLLSTFLGPQAVQFPNIFRESKRFIELWHMHRRDSKNPYQFHNYLPQGILERNEKERRNKMLGTRPCRGCQREFYQDSYALEFRRWPRSPEKQFCWTCGKINLRLHRRTRFLDVLELARSRTSSPSLLSVGEAKV